MVHLYEPRSREALGAVEVARNVGLEECLASQRWVESSYLGY